MIDFVKPLSELGYPIPSKTNKIDDYDKLMIEIRTALFDIMDGFNKRYPNVLLRSNSSSLSITKLSSADGFSKQQTLFLKSYPGDKISAFKLENVPRNVPLKFFKNQLKSALDLPPDIKLDLIVAGNRVKAMYEIREEVKTGDRVYYTIKAR